jgi:hypothetical protein
MKRLRLFGFGGVDVIPKDPTTCDWRWTLGSELIQYAGLFSDLKATEGKISGTFALFTSELPLMGGGLCRKVCKKS